MRTADRNRKDAVTPHGEQYACAGIPEYWVVDPIRRDVFVMVLKDGEYEEHRGSLPGFATSVILNDFSVDVAKMFKNTSCNFKQLDKMQIYNWSIEIFFYI